MDMDDDDAKRRGEEGKATATEDSAGLRSDWAELTFECLLNIFARLSLEDRWRRAMFVCKSWLHAAGDSSLNTVFDLEPQFNSSAESPLWWDPRFQSKIDTMIRYLLNRSPESVVEIRVRHCSDASLSLVAERCPNLEVLWIKSCPNVRDESMSKIAYGCPKLKELDISHCYEVSYKSLELLGSNCPNIRILKRNFMNWLDPSQHVGTVPNEYLDAIPQDCDSEADVIGNLMPHLLHLEIRFSKLSARGLSSISKGCTQLETLDLSGCANVTSRDIVNASSQLKNLKDIKKPNFYIPRSVFHTDRYGHWRLYDERFQTDVFRI